MFIFIFLEQSCANLHEDNRRKVLILGSFVYIASAHSAHCLYGKMQRKCVQQTRNNGHMDKKGQSSVHFPPTKSFHHFLHISPTNSDVNRPMPFWLLFLLIQMLFFTLSSATLRPPIRVTPQPPAEPEDHHGPLALVEPADGFEFVGIGEQQQQRERLVVEPITKHSKKRGYRSCTFKYIPHSCNHTDYCESNRLCVQITGDPCCAPNEGECPTPAQLGVTCLKNKPVNWCHHSQDCARSALCCDTGCGYNMCVERQQI